MAMKRFLAATTALMLGAPPALAHWEWTTWGMTPDEVIAASDGTATAAEPDPSKSLGGFDLRAEGSWSKNGFSYTAGYYFDAAGGLSFVALTLTEPARCGELRAALAEDLGPPQHSVKVADRWTEKDDAISVNDAALIEVCRLVYEKK